MSDELVQLRSGSVAHELTLNRPERHNSLIPELLHALREALQDVVADQPAALVLRSRGRSFSTGGDVRAFYDVGRGKRRDYAASVVGLLNEAILDLLRMPCPTIAAVHGIVTGGSLGLVLACDLTLATPRARFAPWYVDVGFSPDGGWTALLPERIGRARALEIQLLNKTVEAEQALQWGLVQELVPGERLPARAQELAAIIASKKKASIQHTLRLTRPSIPDTAAALDAEYRSFLELIDSDEADTGMAQFLGCPG